MTDSVYVAIIAALSANIGITLNFIYGYIKNKRTKPSLQRAMKTARYAGGCLKNIMDEVKCDRCYFAQLHNGGHAYPTGESMLKFSILHELTRNFNIPRIQSLLQDIPIAVYFSLIDDIYNFGVVKINTPGENSYCLGSLQATAQSKTSYIFKVSNKSQKMLGFVGVNFVNKNVDLTDEQISQIASLINSANLS